MHTSSTFHTSASGPPHRAPADSTPAVTTVVHPLTANITPSTGSTNTCETIQLTLSVQNFETFTVIPDSARWSASDTTAISVNQNGLFRTHAKAIPYDTVRVTIWALGQTTSAQSIWNVEDGGVLVIGPDGKPIPTKCPPGF